MKSNLLKEVNNWTPSFDFINRKYKGHNVGLVLGKMWRYSNMANGVCQASLNRMAEELGIHRDTVKSSIILLEEDGYVIDTTPTLRNHPHTYKIIEEKIIEDNQEVAIERSATESFNTAIEPFNTAIEQFDTGSRTIQLEDNSIKDSIKDSILINKKQKTNEVEKTKTSTSFIKFDPFGKDEQIDIPYRAKLDNIELRVEHNILDSQEIKVEDNIPHSEENTNAQELGSTVDNFKVNEQGTERDRLFKKFQSVLAKQGIEYTPHSGSVHNPTESTLNWSV